MAASGVKELLVVAQDTSAYGLDLRYQAGDWRGESFGGDLEALCRGLGELGIWVGAALRLARTRTSTG